MQLFHNPSCSKSRAALALLEARDAQPEIVAYLENPPTVDQLRTLLGMLGLPPRELLRKGEADYVALGLADETLDDDALINAMVTHPRLIERPILVHEGRAIIGRPPERILDLL